MGANEKLQAAMRGFEPVTESVCERFMHDRYMTDGVNTDESRAEFDRWLEAVRADAKAEAAKEIAESFQGGAWAQLVPGDLRTSLGISQPITDWLLSLVQRYKEAK